MHLCLISSGRKKYYKGQNATKTKLNSKLNLGKDEFFPVCLNIIKVEIEESPTKYHPGHI